MTADSAPVQTAVALDNGLRGVQSTFSYVWIVPSATGAVLIDGGNDEKAANVKEQLALIKKSAADVRAVLLTHGHGDHVAGVAAFGNAEVFIMPQDSAMVKDKPAKLRNIVGPTMNVDSVKFEVFPIPGHTQGSVALIWKNVCFVGDVITRNDGAIAYGPDHYSKSPEKNRESVRSLLTRTFDWIATGHGGLVSRADFEAFLKAEKKQ